MVVVAAIVVPSAKTFIHPTWIPIRTLAPEAIWAGMCAREFRFVLNKESIFIVSKLIVLCGGDEGKTIAYLFCPKTKLFRLEKFRNLLISILWVQLFPLSSETKKNFGMNFTHTLIRGKRHVDFQLHKS